MYIARIPLRVSLLGGGSDLPEFYENGDIPWLVSGDIHKIEINNTVKSHIKDGVALTKFLYWYKFSNTTLKQ